MDELQLFTIGGTSKPFCADLVVNDKQLTMEIDTCCRVTYYRADISKALSRIISTTISRHFEDIHWRTHTSPGRSLSIRPVKSQQKLLNLVIITGNGPCLLVRNWMAEFQQDWTK